MNHSDLQAGVLLDERPGDDDVIAVGSERPVLTPAEWQALRDICTKDPDVKGTEFRF